MSKKKSRFLILLLTVAMFSGLYAKGNQLTMTGSTTVLPVAQAAAEAFMDKYPNVNISVRGGGSGVGVSALISSNCDIANSSRVIKPKEISTARAKGVNPVGYIIANDGITVVVNNTNAVKGLTLQQLKQIYTGQITNWKQVGGPNLPIVVISRDVSSGTFEVFNEKVLAGAKVKDGAMMLASNNAIVSTVGDTPGAIGYAGIGYDNNKIKTLPIDGVMATEQTVKNKTYKLARSLYMYTNGTAKGNAANFISFLQSAEGQKIVVDQGFVSTR